MVQHVRRIDPPKQYELLEWQVNLYLRIEGIWEGRILL